MRLRIASHNYVRKGRKWILAAGILGLTTLASAAMLANLFPFLDPTGMISTYNTNSPINESSNNPFFRGLAAMAVPAEPATWPVTPLASASAAFVRSSSVRRAPTRSSPQLTAPTVPTTLPTILPRTASC
jgi:hypothetical protein